MFHVIIDLGGTPVAHIPDNTIDQTTSLDLAGEGSEYSEALLNKAAVALAQQAAGNKQPPRAIAGQTWYDSSTGVVCVFDGNQWTPLVGTANFGTSLCLTGDLIGNADLDSDKPLTVSLAPVAEPGCYQTVNVEDGRIVGGTKSLKANDVVTALGYAPISTNEPIEPKLPRFGVIEQGVDDALPAGFAYCNGEIHEGVTTPNLNAYAKPGRYFIMKVKP